jgi:hypothetical protein
MPAPAHVLLTPPRSSWAGLTNCELHKPHPAKSSWTPRPTTLWPRITPILNATTREVKGKEAPVETVTIRVRQRHSLWVSAPRP